MKNEQVTDKKWGSGGAGQRVRVPSFVLYALKVRITTKNSQECYLGYKHYIEAGYFRQTITNKGTEVSKNMTVLLDCMSILLEY